MKMMIVTISPVIEVPCMCSHALLLVCGLSKEGRMSAQTMSDHIYSKGHPSPSLPMATSLLLEDTMTITVLEPLGYSPATAAAVGHSMGTSWWALATLATLGSETRKQSLSRLTVPFCLLGVGMTKVVWAQHGSSMTLLSFCLQRFRAPAQSPQHQPATVPAPRPFPMAPSALPRAR